MLNIYNYTINRILDICHNLRNCVRLHVLLAKTPIKHAGFAWKNTWIHVCPQVPSEATVKHLYLVVILFWHYWRSRKKVPK